MKRSRKIVVDSDDIRSAIAEYLTEIPNGANYKCGLYSTPGRFWAEVEWWPKPRPSEGAAGDDAGGGERDLDDGKSGDGGGSGA